MKVKELIEYLNKFNPDADIVFVSDFENDVSQDITEYDFGWLCDNDSNHSDSEYTKKHAERVMLIKETTDEHRNRH
jgi:lipopolysaccharide biosynthesis glycosyltransferase